MCDYIINIHSSELLRTKPKSLKLMNIKKKWTIYIFYLIIFLQDFLNIKKEKEKRITIIKIYQCIYMGLQISAY